MEICTEIPSLPVALLILILSICFGPNKKISGQPLSHLSQTKVAILKTILF
jgi:hypothetical protein